MAMANGNGMAAVAGLLVFSPSLFFEMPVGCESVFFFSVLSLVMVFGGFGGYIKDGRFCSVLFFPSLFVYLFTWVVLLEEGD